MPFTQLINDQKKYFKSQITKDINWRTTQLNKIKRLVIENEQALLQALANDLAKPYQESWMTELSYITSEVDHTLKHLKKWAALRRVNSPLVTWPARSFIQPEPLGTVLIIGAWNYPLQLILSPLVAVIAAGNCAILKPSELAPATAQLLETLLPQYLDPQAVSLVQGGVEQTTALLNGKFDHIMYTGNGQVAKLIMAAAAKNLTPMTLELGGKSPVFIDDSADIAIAAQRLAWGKWLNAGQTCIAPDHVMVTSSLLAPLLTALKTQIVAMFGEEPKLSESYGRIINQRHTKRLADYLTEGNIVLGGDIDLNNRYISPTIVVNPEMESALMQEEIFGPILPIIVVDDFQHAMNLIIEHDKPLAAYLFTRNKEQEQQWLTEISAGSVAINDVMMFSAVADLPFGGVGASGFGQYSGKVGFDNFSHLKAVIKRPFLKDLALRFAPFTQKKLRTLKWFR